MRKLGRNCFVMFLAVIMVLGMLFPASAGADDLQGLVQTGGTYYYYSNGQMLRNKWMTAEVDGAVRKLYFGKNGAAYKAAPMYQNAYNVKLYKIKGKKYGFDMNSCLVQPGVYVNDSYSLLVFGKNGKYNNSKTKKLRRRLKLGKISKKMYKTVLSALGNPVSVSFSDSCSPWNERDTFTDVLLVYSHFEVQLIRDDNTGEYMLDGYFPR